MIELNDSLIIGKGSERICYQHPSNSDLCIKVRYRHKRSKDESERELAYVKSLKVDPSLLPIAFPIEWVDTTVGRGMVFPLIRDSDGSISQPLNSKMNISEVKRLYDIFSQALLNNAISVTDLRLHNLVVQKTGENSKIIMIDGYGYTNTFLAFLYRWTKALTLFQTKRRINKIKNRYMTNG